MTALDPRQGGSLEQVCPRCGLREAAGSYCTACATPTGPGDWRRPTLSDAQRAARVGRHSRDEVAPTATKSAEPAVVA